MRPLVCGPCTGYLSYPTVLKGLLRGLCYHGIEPVVLDTAWHGGDHGNGELDDLPITWTTERDRCGSDPVCFGLNPSIAVAESFREEGFALAGMHVGDVDRIPAEWAEVIKMEAATFAPSQWLRAVIGPSTIVVPHGVGPAFKQRVAIPDNPMVVVLHTCSAMYFPERKGTPQALEAFERVIMAGHRVSMTLVVPMLTKPLRALLGRLAPETRDRINVLQYPEGQAPDTMAELYGAHDVLLCPSRGEGFGMQTLEARACGVPVVQTGCTGLADGLPVVEDLAHWGIVPVEHGDLEPAWGDFGRAPGVSIEAVERALLIFLANRKTLAQAAMDHASTVSRRWSWERTTEPLATGLRALM